MNRRNFVARAVGAAVGLHATGLALASIPASATPLGRLPYQVIFDRRFDVAAEFAASAARLGSRVEAICGDVTALWRDDLRGQWARGEGAIVGMTTASSFRCLEILARDHWMKVVARLEHRAASAGWVEHRLFTRGTFSLELRAALAADARWPAQLAAPMIGQLNRARSGRADEFIVLTADSSWRARSEPLVTWAIAA